MSLEVGMTVAQQELITIAEALQYPKLVRLKEWAKTADDDVASGIIRTTISEPFTILFFPGKCLQITPFGWSFTRILTSRSDHYLLAHAQLNEAYLRRVFTGLELIVYKLCHIALEDQRPEYHFESQKLAQRFKRLKSLLNVPDWAEFASLFDDISFVRNAFAHSFVPIEDLLYCDVPLKRCFGDSYLGRSFNDEEHAGSARIFTNDLKRLFDPIMKMFYEKQLLQMDSRKFVKLCDRLLMKRSLSPKP
jgi:hypothetical protein